MARRLARFAALILLLSTGRAAASVDLTAAQAAFDSKHYGEAVAILTDSLGMHPYDMGARELRARAGFHWMGDPQASYDFEFLYRRRVEDPEILAMHALYRATATSNMFAPNAGAAERELLSRARAIAPNHPYVLLADWILSQAPKPKDGNRKGLEAWLKADSSLYPTAARFVDKIVYDVTFDTKPFMARKLPMQSPARSRSSSSNISKSWPDLSAIDMGRRSGDHATTLRECDLYLSSHPADDWHVGTVMYWKGEALLGLDRLDEALTTLIALQRRGGLHAEAKRLEAHVYAKQKLTAKALRAAEAALETRLLTHSLRKEDSDWPYWWDCARMREDAGQLERALEAVQRAEAGASFYSDTPPLTLSQIAADRDRLVNKISAYPRERQSAGVIGALLARNWLAARGSDEMFDAPAGFVTRWSSDSTVDIIDEAGLGVRLEPVGIGYLRLGGPETVTKKGAKLVAVEWTLPRQIADGTLVYDFGNPSGKRYAMRLSPQGDFFIGPYDLVSWEGAFVMGNGLRIPPPYRFGMPPVVTEKPLDLQVSTWKDGGGYYDESTQYKEILADSSVRYSATIKRLGEFRPDAFFSAIAIPGEGLFVGSLMDGGPKVPWLGVLYTNDDRALGYMNGARVMEVALGKAAKGNFNVPKVEYDATFYWELTPEGRLTWDRTVGGLQRYRFWASGLWGALDNRPDRSYTGYSPPSVSTARPVEDEPDNRGSNLVGQNLTGKRGSNADVCKRCGGRGRVYSGSYMGQSNVCEPVMGGGVKCYTVTRENTTAMRTCSWCGGTGRR